MIVAVINQLLYYVQCWEHHGIFSCHWPKMILQCFKPHGSHLGTQSHLFLATWCSTAFVDQTTWKEGN